MSRQLLKQSFFLAVWSSLIGSNAGLSANSGTDYRIISVEGTVLLWEPFATTWTYAEPGMMPNSESVIQVRRNSSVEIEVKNQKTISGVGDSRVSFRINKPIIGRLNDRYLRSMTINQMFFDELPDVEEAPETPNDQITATLDEAWDRFAAIFTGDEIPLKSLERSLSAQASEDFELKLEQQKISISAPSDNATLTASDFPLGRFIYWQLENPPEEDLVFDVYLWKKGEQPGTPVGSTKEKKYKLQLHPGVYQLQVTSRDGSFNSKVRTITVLESGSLAEGPNGVRGAGDGSHRQEISLISPPNNFRNLSNRDVSPIYFHWTNESDLSTNRKFEFTIVTTSGKPVFKKQTYDNRVLVRLRTGQYRWWVDQMGADLEWEQKPADSRGAFVLTIDRRKKDWISQIDDQILETGGIIYVDGEP